jgi:glycosyltransferase involved in cell wall biosynthesis
MEDRVCHLLDKDVNLDTPYFWSIARQHDHGRFPVMFCTTASAGALQKSLNEAGTPQFSLGATGRLHYPMAILRLARLLRRERVSILHAHFFDPTFIGLVAAKLARVRFVFTRHHSDHNTRLGKKWHSRIDALCGRGADHVIAVSEATRQIMVEQEGVPAHQITTVYNGMNSLREPSRVDIEKVRRELGLGDEPVLLMLARLHEEKGHRFLFEAIPEILATVGKVTILLAGEGPHRSDLEREVRARGLQNTVRFLGRRTDVPELITLASVLVLPSLAESFGFALVEAMSLGKPAVASTAGGIPEVVVNGETGLLVPPADSKALADAICRVLNTPGLAQTLGNGGRKRASLFTFDRMILGYEEVYERVCKRAFIGRRSGIDNQSAVGELRADSAGRDRQA